MARYLAVEYLKKYNSKEVIVKLAYAIGKKDPVMATAVCDGKSIDIQGYDLSPGGIIKFLNLRKPQFKKRARYGFFYDFLTWYFFINRVVYNKYLTKPSIYAIFHYVLIINKINLWQWQKHNC